MPRIKPPKPQIGAIHLNQVVSVQEAAYAWCRAPETIKYSIDRGYLTAQRIGYTWIIAVPSLVAHYGKPAREILR